MTDAVERLVRAAAQLHPARVAAAAAGLAWTAQRFAAYRRQAAAGVSPAERRAWRLVAAGGMLLVAGLALVALAGAPLPAGPALLAGLGAIAAGAALWFSGHLRVGRAGRDAPPRPVT